jgi:hypothetical protein
VIEYRAGDFQSVSPGISLPRACTISLHPPNDRTPRRDYQLRINRLEINGEVPDRAFQPDLRPGTLIFSWDGRFESAIPAGTDLLDEWAATAVCLLPPQSPPILSWTANLPAVILGLAFLGLGWRLIAHSGPVSGRRSDTPTPIADLGRSQEGENLVDSEDRLRPVAHRP